ncbi:MAG: circularly permuted type 2 ATP-grasp protein [Planctomycetaceae bacterium]
MNNLDFSTLANPNLPLGVFNEAFEGGQPRPHWTTLIAELSKFSPEELTRRTLQAKQRLDENGVIFNVFGGAGGQRPWNLDLLPLLLSREQWGWMQLALEQRGKLMQRILQDVYGPQTLLQCGLLPPGVIYPQRRYQRECTDLHGSGVDSLMLFGTELARSPNGDWYVMADRTDAPIGLGFVLENRITTARLMPQVVHRLGLERLAPFFIHLKNALLRMCPAQKEHPRVVMLSSGPQSRFYFEDVYLARYLGFTLVEGGDLAVRDDCVFLKTLSGLKLVDVILSRCADSAIDPLEQGAAANNGVPGLMQAVRAGNVRLANTPGSGLLEAPVFMAFLPQLCQHLLNQDLMLPSIPTWWCGDPVSLAMVWSRFDELVIKPAFQSSGQEEFVVCQMTAEERSVLRMQIEDHPERYVAQERIERSAAPCWRDNQLQSGHVALRTFCVAAEKGGYHLLPGGLVRLAATPEPMELSVLGGVSSKDLWIQADGPPAMVTLLDDEAAPVQLKRSDALFPSRVADNLYWMGQSLERADFLARLMRATIERMTSESDEDVPELAGLLRALLDQGQLEPAFLVDDFSKTLPTIEQYLSRVIFDPTEHNGLGNAVAELRRLGSTVRDWISVEMWNTTRHAVDHFFAASSEVDDLSEALSAIDRLILELASISGLIQDGMIRGPSWRFLDVGRRIDRGRNIATLLLSAIESKQISQRSMLKALLEVLDCRMTYRSRYLENVQQNGVLDLAITDETNPHSIVFQASVLEDHIEALPQNRHPLRSREKRILMKIVHEVRMVSTDDLEQTPPSELTELLKRVDANLKLLADNLMRKYLVLAVPPRQIIES